MLNLLFQRRNLTLQRGNMLQNFLLSEGVVRPIRVLSLKLLDVIIVNGLSQVTLLFELGVPHLDQLRALPKLFFFLFDLSLGLFDLILLLPQQCLIFIELRLQLI